MSRRIRQLQLGMISTLVASIMLLALYLFYAIHMFEESKKPTVITRPIMFAGPDIRHCFDEAETRELWDCIRNVGD